MRVISGTAKRLQLKTIDGTDTRPTPDRIKETLFNMLGTGLVGCTFLDLFAGSGGIGIEALSRGAKQVIFVENNPKAVACIKDNLHHTKLQERAQVHSGDAFMGLAELEGKVSFDYIYMDPPYNQGYEQKIMEYLATSNIIHDDSVIIIEASIHTEISEIIKLGFSLIKEKKYKTNKHIYIEREGKQAIC